MIRNPSINDNKKLQEYKRVTLETLVTTTETKQKRIANLSTKFDEVSTNLAADALSFWALALLFWSWRCLLVELPELINKPEKSNFRFNLRNGTLTNSKYWEYAKVRTEN
jgi:hypothetical protein